ncbi:MAG: TonB-dependent receptor domain-containing protein [Vulcanimicrobiaceae bacterium]
MPRSFVRHALVPVLLVVAMLCQVTWALAGTTGALSGTVVSTENNAPLANAKVTASSPSGTTSVNTDASGHFSFLSLNPDTYSVSVDKDGYQPLSQPGVSVFADQTQTLTLHMEPALKTIARTTSRAAGALLKPGTTADVYSVDATTASKVNALGGGGSLDQAYSAVASVPGAYVPTGSAGWNQTILIRGGDYSQVGYEYDGVPVNRSFDNYPAHTASALGQQELEVYSGSSPANAESTGLAGFINQVIRTGTYPGFGNGDVGIGTPTFYHKATAEAGGASPNRLFSYYVGIGGYNQGLRYFDQQNGATQTLLAAFPVGQVTYFGTQPCPTPGDANFVSCYAASGAFGDGGPVGPGNYVMGPYQTTQFANLNDRENVVNLHFGIPHKKYGGQDDIQLLYDTSSLLTSIYDSANDWAQPGTIPFGAPPSSWTFNGSAGKPLSTNPATLAGQISPYFFPTIDAGLNTLPATRRGVFWNDDSIIKLQYQHNMGSNAFLRIYGYSFYSDWLNNDPNTVSTSNFFGNGLIPEYELDTHTRGGSLSFADQIDPKNLINAQASTVYSTVVRFNNSSYLTAGRKFGYVVDASSPNSGICYSLDATGAGTPTDCYGSPSTVRLPGGATSGTSPQDPAFLAQFTSLNLANPTGCGGHPCELLAAESGLNGTLNNVNPTFNAYSLTDAYRPTDKILLNVGLRYETFQFKGADTNTGARPFWFNAWNLSHCIGTSPGSAPVDVGYNATLSGPACAPGQVPATLFNEPVNYFYNEFEPRISGTFTINPLNVIRFSYGRYAQPANTAAEQYNVAQENLPGFIGPDFLPAGFNQPGHNIPPEASNNYDLSWEHQLKGTNMSWKITPFIRSTLGEQTSLFIDPVHLFVSSIPVGNLTSKGFEFAFHAGDFNRNGWAGQLAFTYAFTQIKYTTLGNGGTPLSVINNDIATYNALTSFCAGHASDSRCRLGNGVTPTDPATGSPLVAAPCYTAVSAAGGGIVGAVPAPCGSAGSYANPYWNAPVQGLFNLNGPYFPTDTVVAQSGLGVNSYAVPYVATLIVNYKWNKLAVTPTIQFVGGQRYGVPETTEGVDPAAGCLPLAPLAANDPRYTGGTAGLSGNSYDATSCISGLRAIPNPFTGVFDNIGSFVAPSQLLGGFQLTYDVTPKIQVRATVANVFVACIGGSVEPWTGNGNHRTCGYTGTASAFVSNPVGNFYNPGATIQANTTYPYLPYYGVYNPNGPAPNGPFNLFIDARFRI